MLIHMNVFSYYVRVVAIHQKKQCDLIHTIVDGDHGAGDLWIVYQSGRWGLKGDQSPPQ